MVAVAVEEAEAVEEVADEAMIAEAVAETVADTVAILTRPTPIGPFPASNGNG